jgi:hypothetical protein
LLGNETCTVNSDCCNEKKICNNKAVLEVETNINTDKKSDTEVQNITQDNHDAWICGKASKNWILMFFKDSADNSKSLRTAFKKV